MLKAAAHMAAYDEFAWFYNRYWNEDFHSLAFPILERIWLTHLPEGARILDLCCGTGYLAGMLTERGYSATGVDESSAMIAHARQNVPGAEFLVGDAGSVHFPRQFDGAVSTFDSLNHLTEPEKLTRAFTNAAAALKPGGLIAFDVLFQEAYETHWGESFALVRDDHVLTITGSAFDFRNRLARCNITMFRLVDGTWRRADVEVVERCYSPAEIDRALDTAGFAEIRCYPAEDLGMAGQLGSGRVFYVAAAAG